MARRFVLHAPNVHQGGGGTLLRGLLSQLPDRPGDLILDVRFDVDDFLDATRRFTIHRVAPTLTSRLNAERLLSRLCDSEAQALCFAGFPPLFPCRGKVSVFVQNRNVISRTDLSGYSWRQRARIELERLWFRTRCSLADEFLVQTETMRDLLQPIVGQRPIRVQPFVPLERPAIAGTVGIDRRLGARGVVGRMGGRGIGNASGGLRHPAQEEPLYDFCYVATGEPHKNHRRLIEAWILLAQSGQFPSLCLTLPPHFVALLEWIDTQVAQHGLRVQNCGELTRDEIDDLYRRSRRLVFPSLYESFGLPLLEAQSHGLPIVAAERDYVRDIVAPEHTFDPESPRSIARAIERALEQKQSPPKIATPAEFLNELLAAA